MVMMKTAVILKEIRDSGRDYGLSLYLKKLRCFFNVQLMIFYLVEIISFDTKFQVNTEGSDFIQELNQTSPEAGCPRCNTCAETVSHVLFECKAAKSMRD